MRRRADPVRLLPGALYLSPRGLLCSLCPADSRQPVTSYATLLYAHTDGHAGTDREGAGFTLSAANFHLLRRVA